jgi:hypothetical protein
MKMEKARRVTETVRREMTAEALALAYHRSTHLGKRAVIDVIAATMDLIGDPLDKVWIEDVTGKRHTYRLEQAQSVLGDRADFRYLWAIPASERRNSKSRWLTAVTIDNVAVHGATLFFALPRGLAQEFAPHVALVRMLARAAAVPQYGFGYAREYGNPDYFALSYVNKTSIKALDRPSWVRSAALGDASAGNPAEHRDRYARRLIVDVFPMNVLSDAHLKQKVGGESLKEWILRTTGPESLIQVEPRCFAWFVPAARTAAISARLKASGMMVCERPEAVC